MKTETIKSILTYRWFIILLISLSVLVSIEVYIITIFGYIDQNGTYYMCSTTGIVLSCVVAALAGVVLSEIYEKIVEKITHKG